MRRRYLCLRVSVFASILGALGCGGGSHYSYQNVVVTMSPNLTSLPVNANQTFTTATTNAPNYPTWFVDAAGVSGAGMIGFQAGRATALYTAPDTPPIYTPDQLALGHIQGQVTVTAFVNSNPQQVFADAEAVQVFTITAPTVTTGIAPETATVARGATQQFTGYAVGNVNGSLLWQVNGVTGGGTATGTVSATGLYTAPAAVPMSGPAVAVTAVSAADPTRSSSAAVTLD